MHVERDRRVFRQMERAQQHRRVTSVQTITSPLKSQFLSITTTPIEQFLFQLSSARSDKVRRVRKMQSYFDLRSRS